MRDPLIALSRDFVTRVYKWLVLYTSTLVALPFVFAVSIRWRFGSGLSDQQLSQGLAALQVPMVGVAAMLFSCQTIVEVARARRRFFAIPVTSTMLAAWQVGIVAIAVGTAYGVTLFGYQVFYHAQWTFFSPLLFLVGIASWLIVVAWRYAPLLDVERANVNLMGLAWIEVLKFVGKQSILLVPGMVACVVWFNLHIGNMGIAAWRFVPDVDLVLFLGMVASSWWLLRQEIATQRCGDTPQLNAGSDALPSTSKGARIYWPTSQAAFRWMLGRATRPFLITLTLVCLVALLILVSAIYLEMHFDRTREQEGTWSVVCMLAPVIVGIALGLEAMPFRRGGFRTDWGTLPLSDGELARLIFGNAARIYVLCSVVWFGIATILQWMSGPWSSQIAFTHGTEGVVALLVGWWIIGIGIGFGKRGFMVLSFGVILFWMVSAWVPVKYREQYDLICAHWCVGCPVVLAFVLFSRAYQAKLITKAESLTWLVGGLIACVVSLAVAQEWHSSPVGKLSEVQREHVFMVIECGVAMVALLRAAIALRVYHERHLI